MSNVFAPGGLSNTRKDELDTLYVLFGQFLNDLYLPDTSYAHSQKGMSSLCNC